MKSLLKWFYTYMTSLLASYACSYGWDGNLLSNLVGRCFALFRWLGCTVVVQDFSASMPSPTFYHELNSEIAGTFSLAWVTAYLLPFGLL